MADNVTPIGLSIQGEQQHERDKTYFRMDQDEVDELVAGMPEESLPCRAGRHLFPIIRPREGVRFDGANEHGQLVQRLRCVACRLVDRVILWGPEKRGKDIRWRPVDSRLDYSVRGPHGEQYLFNKPGHGRMAPRQVQEALMTQALKGMSLNAVLKAAQDQTVVRRPVRRRKAG
jgi:hypothetical protein